MISLNERDKNSMLDSMLNEGETYKSKIWGVIMASNVKIGEIGMASAAVGLITNTAIGGAVAGGLGALSNQYCYIGITESAILFSIVNTFKVSEVKGTIRLPLNKIKKVKVRRSFIPGRRVITIDLNDESKMVVSVMSSTIGSDIKNQKENAANFIKILEQYE